MVFYFFLCVFGKFKSVLLILLVLLILFKLSIFVPVMLSTCTQLEREITSPTACSQAVAVYHLM